MHISPSVLLHTIIRKVCIPIPKLLRLTVELGLHIRINICLGFRSYLLRTEAYLALNDKDKAAADINVIRNRAHAKPVLTSQVTLDYILDERMRELGVEERRRITLMRMGKLYDRVMKCNPYYAKEMKKHYELWPIPYKEIEANRGAVLEQNPGYE